MKTIKYIRKWPWQKNPEDCTPVSPASAARWAHTVAVMLADFVGGTTKREYFSKNLTGVVAYWAEKGEMPHYLSFISAVGQRSDGTKFPWVQVNYYYPGSYKRGHGFNQLGQRLLRLDGDADSIQASVSAVYKALVGSHHPNPRSVFPGPDGPGPSGLHDAVTRLKAVQWSDFTRRLKLFCEHLDGDEGVERAEKMLERAENRRTSETSSTWDAEARSLVGILREERFGDIDREQLVRVLEGRHGDFCPEWVSSP